MSTVSLTLDGTAASTRKRPKVRRIIGIALLVLTVVFALLATLQMQKQIDLADEEQLGRVEEYFRGKGYDYFPMSAPIHYGVDELIAKIVEMLSKLPPIAVYEPEPMVPEEVENKREFHITRQDGVYFVEAPWLLPIMRSVNFDDYESMQYFERVLNTSGIIDGLREAGVQERDTVSIYDFEFDFVN